MSDIRSVFGENPKAVRESRLLDVSKKRPYLDLDVGSVQVPDGHPLRERLRRRAVFAVRPIADSPLVMVLAEREPCGPHRILVLTPSPPELLSRRGLAHIGCSSARLYALGLSKVQSVHSSAPNLYIAGHADAILQGTGVRSKSEDSEVAGNRPESGWQCRKERTRAPQVPRTHAYHGTRKNRPVFETSPSGISCAGKPASVAPTGQANELPRSHRPRDICATGIGRSVSSS